MTVTSLISAKKLSDFDYELPKELIAQSALLERTKARLMVLNRTGQTVEHGKFQDIGNYFRKGDVLVLNDTKVLPARLFAKRKTGGKVEILLLKCRGGTPWPPNAPMLKGQAQGPAPTENGQEIWQVLIRPSNRVRGGEIIF